MPRRAPSERRGSGTIDQPTRTRRWPLVVGGGRSVKCVVYDHAAITATTQKPVAQALCTAFVHLQCIARKLSASSNSRLLGLASRTRQTIQHSSRTVSERYLSIGARSSQLLVSLQANDETAKTSISRTVKTVPANDLPFFRHGSRTLASKQCGFMACVGFCDATR